MSEHDDTYGHALTAAYAIAFMALLAVILDATAGAFALDFGFIDRRGIRAIALMFLLVSLWLVATHWTRR